MITDRRPRDDRPLLPSTTPRWNRGDPAARLWASDFQRAADGMKRTLAKFAVVSSASSARMSRLALALRSKQRREARPIEWASPQASRHERQAARSRRTQLLRVDRRRQRRAARRTSVSSTATYARGGLIAEVWTGGVLTGVPSGVTDCEYLLAPWR